MKKEWVDGLLVVLGKGKPANDEMREEMARELMDKLGEMRSANAPSPTDTAIQQEADQLVSDGIAWNMQLVGGYLMSVANRGAAS